MKRVFITALFLILCFSAAIEVSAKERTVTQVGKTGIISNGLYFKICDVNTTSKNIDVTVRVKNKSMLSQAVYVELTDTEGNTYEADNKDAISFFKPLKFNKPITQKISFTVPTTTKKYWLAVYNKDIFKKNRKQIITKMSVNDAKKELHTK